MEESSVGMFGEILYKTERGIVRGVEVVTFYYRDLTYSEILVERGAELTWWLSEQILEHVTVVGVTCIPDLL